MHNAIDNIQTVKAVFYALGVASTILGIGIAIALHYASKPKNDDISDRIQK